MSLSAWNYDGDVPSETGTQSDSMAYKELKGSGKAQFNNDGGMITREFLVAWGSQFAFIDDLLGYATLDNQNNIQRVLPDQHPDYTQCYAAEITSVEGVGAPQFGTTTNVWSNSTLNTVHYLLAKIAVVYRPLDYAVNADSTNAEFFRFCSFTYQNQAEYMTLQAIAEFIRSFNGVKTKLGSGFGKINSSMQVEILWHDVPAKLADPYHCPTEKRIRDMSGKINDDPFLFDNVRFPMGTVLFLGAECKMKVPRMAKRNYLWDITYKFSIRNNGAGFAGDIAGHNYFYDLRAGRWDLLTSNGFLTGNKCFESADLNDLFVIDA